MAIQRAVVVPRRQAKIDTISIDACFEETHELSNTITDHPVEQGYNITDHVRPNPESLSMRCFVSNTPISTEQLSQAIKEGNVQFQSAAPQAVELGAIGGRADNAFKQLKKLRDDGTLVTIVTSLKTYGVSATEGLAIESISISRTVDNFDGLEFTIKLKQIRIVRNRSTQQTAQKDPRTRKKAKKGHKPAAAADDHDTFRDMNPKSVGGNL